MDNYKVLSIIGKGTYGIVSKAKDQTTGQIVAIKQFTSSISKDQHAYKIAKREVAALKVLKGHENVVRLLKTHISKKGNVYLIFEYCESTVLDRILSSPPKVGMNKNEMRSIIYQLLNSIQHVHNTKFLHRDIKPENLLLSSSGVLKLCDFGFARPTNSTGIYTEYVSTRWYRAPELLVGDTNYSHAVDVWAIGCLVAEMVLCRPVFPGESEIDQLNMVIQTLGDLTTSQRSAFEHNAYYERASRPICWASPPPGLAPLLANLMDPLELDFVQCCLRIDPQARATISTLLSHPWFNSTWKKNWPPLYAEMKARDLAALQAFDSPTLSLTSTSTSTTTSSSSSTESAVETDLSTATETEKKSPIKTPKLILPSPPSGLVTSLSPKSPKPPPPSSTPSPKLSKKSGPQHSSSTFSFSGFSRFMRKATSKAFLEEAKSSPKANIQPAASAFTANASSLTANTFPVTQSSNHNDRGHDNDKDKCLEHSLSTSSTIAQKGTVSSPTSSPALINLSLSPSTTSIATSPRSQKSAVKHLLDSPRARSLQKSKSKSSTKAIKSSSTSNLPRHPSHRLLSEQPSTLSLRSEKVKGVKSYGKSQFPAINKKNGTKTTTPNGSPSMGKRYVPGGLKVLHGSSTFVHLDGKNVQLSPLTRGVGSLVSTTPTRMRL